MQWSKTKLLVFAVAFLLFRSLPAAEEPGMYAGLGYGMSYFAGERVPANSLIFVPGSQLEDTDTIAKLFAGYRFKKYFSLELSYVDLGKFVDKHSFIPDMAFIPEAVPDDTFIIDANGMTLSPAVRLAITDHISLFARAGLSMLWISQQSTGGVHLNPGSPQRAIDQDTLEVNGFWGGGLQFNATPRVSFRLEYERFYVLDATIDSGTASIIYHF
jgi:opacity protein-like surface antigen